MKPIPNQSIVGEQIVKTAEGFVGIMEEPRNSNRGEVIDKIQREFGYLGVAYCALFALYVYKKVFKMVHLPFTFPITASSQTLYNWAFDNKLVFKDPALIKPGDIIVWRKFKLWQGHVGIAVKEMVVNGHNSVIETIEGNTSPGSIGSQRNGGGIWRRQRRMDKSDFDVDAFYYRGFIDLGKVIRHSMDELTNLDIAEARGYYEG